VGVQRSSLMTYSLDLDIGEVADGYRMVVRGVSLRGENLLFECEFVPEPAEGAEVWPTSSGPIMTGLGISTATAGPTVITT
jgi:hypothetical protein